MLQADPVSSMQWDLGTVLRDADLKAAESRHSGIARIQGRSSLGIICKQKARKKTLSREAILHPMTLVKIWVCWEWKGLYKVLFTSVQSPGGGYINPSVYDNGA